MRTILERLWTSALSPIPVPLLDEDIGRETELWPLKDAGLLLQLPSMRHVICPRCGEHTEEVISIRYPDGRIRFYIPCPESGREEVFPDQLTQWGILFAGVPDFLARSLSLPGARCHVEDKLWHLGEYRGKAGRGDLWLGRWLNWYEHASLFDNIPRDAQTILLYLGKTPDPALLGGIPPGNAISISDLISMNGHNLELTTKPIEAALARNNASAAFGYDGCVFKDEGDVWRIVYEGQSIMRKHSLGMRYLQHLLTHPGQCFMASGLRKLTHPDFVDGLAESLRHEVTDGQSIRRYIQRLRDIPEEIETAQRNNEFARVAMLHDEKHALLDRMRKDASLGGRIRAFASEGQKLHHSLAKAVHRSIDGLRDKHLSLWRHLTNNIKIRNSFTYLPEENLRWQT